MEYADNGDLDSKVEELKKKKEYMAEKDIWNYAIKILNGLVALHKLKIVHRDIKCANVFLYKNGNAKLGDLNVSKIAKSGFMQT
jgi:NIMA (never in mitosis gene a)-related kinase